MAKYLKALLIMLALTVGLSGALWAQTVPVPQACITFNNDTAPEVVSQEAACSCYYGDGGYAYGTLYIPNWYFTLGVDYWCNSHLPPNGPDGGIGKEITFTLASNAQGNCVDQHGDAKTYPRFWYDQKQGTNFYLQIALRDGSGGQIMGWDCQDKDDKAVWVIKSGTGNGEQSATFIRNGAGPVYMRDCLVEGCTPGPTVPANNPFWAGTIVRMATKCESTKDEPNNIPIDSCTLCTNCSYVTLTKTGLSGCPGQNPFDPPTNCPVQDGLSTPPWTIFRSMNQFSTTVVPGPGPIHGQFIGKLLFNGIVDIYYAPEVTGQASKTKSGFTNNPQSWDVVDNYTDMGCFYFCSNTAQVCGDYCCYGPLFYGIESHRLITDSASFKFDIVATQKWDAGLNQVLAWVGDKRTADKIKDGVMGNASGSTAPTGYKTAFNMFFDLSTADLQALGIDLTTTEGARVSAPICIFAQTQNKAKAILTRSFTLDYAKVELSDQRSFYWKEWQPYPLGKFPVLPPDNKRWMGAWRINGMQFAVGAGYTEPRYKTRCMFANKSDEAVSVWFDMTALQSCAATGQDYYTCLETKIDANSNLWLGKVAPHSLKYVELDRQIAVFKGADGAYDPDVVPNPIPLSGLVTLDRYSYTFTVGTDPTNQITNIGAAAGNAFHLGPIADGQDFNPGNWEIYSGTPIGPAYEAPVQVTCIQKDISGDWRTLPVNTGTWNANPWQN